MDQPLPGLPMELILDILELLLASTDRAAQRSGVWLSQTCRALRTSEAGKRARYVNARHSLSMPVHKLPAHPDYEVSVLEKSRWPHTAPVFDQFVTDRDSGLDLGTTGFLRGSQLIVLSVERTSVSCFDFEPGTVPALSETATPAQLEFGTLRNVFHLDATVSRLAVDVDGDFCALAYKVTYLPRQDYSVAPDMLPQRFEIRRLSDGSLVEEPGVMTLDNRFGRCESMDIIEGYIILRYSRLREVRRWCPQSPRNFELIWSNSTDFYATSTTLLAPNFLALHKSKPAPFGSSERRSTGGSLEIHRLPGPGSSGTLHLATFHFRAYPIDFRAGDVASGAKIAPGESGIFVVSVCSAILLMTISDLVEILYSSDAATSGQARILDEQWVLSNMFKVDAPSQCFYLNPMSVTAWRCAVMTCTTRNRWNSMDREDSLQFVDASFMQQHDDATEIPDYRSVKWRAKNRQVVVYEHPLEAYLDTQITGNPVYRWQIELDGGRMLLGAQPERQSENYPNVPAFYLRTWRL